MLSKIAEWSVGAFVASADVERAFDGIKHDDVAKSLLQNANPVISKVELICQVLQCRLSFNMLVVLVREVWKALTCGSKYWTTHFVNLQVAGIGGNPLHEAQKRRVSFCQDVKDEGRVLHD